MNKINVGEIIDAKMQHIDERDDNSNEIHTRLTKTTDDKNLTSDLHFKLNSINILCGMTGSGKTRLVFYEVAKLQYLKNPYTQFIYVTDEENDKTYLKYKGLISIPIIKVKYNFAYDEICNIINAKNIYEKSLTIPVLDKSQLQELKLYLNAEDKIVHTLVLFDDATNIFTDKKNPLNELILKNRHHKITYFFNVHSYNRQSVPMVYKKNASCLFLFGGYSKTDFDSFFNQFRSPISKKELWEEYSVLSRRDVLLFNYCGDTVSVESLMLS
jgi:hypothetical protein